MQLIGTLFIFFIALYCVSGRQSGEATGYSSSGTRGGSYINSGSEKGYVIDAPDKEKNQYSEQVCKANGYTGHFISSHCEAFCHHSTIGKASSSYNLPDGTPCRSGREKCKEGICGGPPKVTDESVAKTLDLLVELIFATKTQAQYLDPKILEQSRQVLYQQYKGKEKIVDNALEKLLSRAKNPQ